MAAKKSSAQEQADSFSLVMDRNLALEVVRVTEALANAQLPINHTAFDEPATVAAWHSKPSWFVVSDKDLILDPSAQKFFANRIKATTTIVEGGHDTLIAFPKQVAAAIEAASRGANP